MEQFCISGNYISTIQILISTHSGVKHGKHHKTLTGICRILRIPSIQCFALSFRKPTPTGSQQRSFHHCQHNDTGHDGPSKALPVCHLATILFFLSFWARMDYTVLAGLTISFAMVTDFCLSLAWPTIHTLFSRERSSVARWVAGFSHSYDWSV